MSLSYTAASDLAAWALDYYIKGKVFKQTIQDKPLLRAMEGAKETFPGGKENISIGVQGAFMNSTSGFFSGFSHDEELVFKQANNLLRAQYAWKECHAGLIISETDLKKDGISVSDDMSTSDHSGAEVTRLAAFLKNSLEDFGESWSRAMNDMLWRDGTQDAEVSPGVQAFLTATPATGTTGGLNRATYAWWRHRSSLSIAPSEANQTLTKEIRAETRQLRRYGGRPNIALCGSDFIEALEGELQAKGLYSQTGFRNEGQNNIGMAKISMLGLGTFEYDPTLDDLSLSKYCFVIDPTRLKLMPMEGEENKMRNPKRPYNYLVFLQSMTWTGALCASQLNAHEVFSIA